MADIRLEAVAVFIGIRNCHVRSENEVGAFVRDLGGAIDFLTLWSGEMKISMVRALLDAAAAE